MRKEEKSPLLEKIGLKIEKRRLELGLEKAELASKTNMSRMQLDRIIKGETNPSIVILERICNTIEMSLSELVSSD